MKTGKHSIVRPLVGPSGAHSVVRPKGPAHVRVASTVGFALAGTALCGMSTMQVFAASPAAFAEAHGDGQPDSAAQGVSVTSALAWDAASDASEKSETVYVFTKPDGTAKNIEVASELKNAGGAALLRDESSLSGIENTEGDEEYSKNAEGLVWDAQGKDIYYKGASDKEAPVALKVTYWLDGRKVAPAELAGKSGKVKIRYDYENRSSEMREVGGVQERIYTPFACITGLVLDNDKFKDVKVDGGRVMDDGDRSIVAGIALPGMRDNLRLGADIDVDVPEYLEVEAETSGFELNSTLTYVSSDIFSDVDSDKLDTGRIEDALDGLSSGIDQLIDGSRSLMKGLNKLSAGTGKLKDKTAKLPEQAGQLDAGARKLESGLAQLDAGAGTLSEGIGALKTGLEGGVISINALVTALSGIGKGLASANTYLGQAESDADTASSGIEAAKKKLHDADSVAATNRGIADLLNDLANSITGSENDDIKREIKQAADELYDVNDTSSSETVYDMLTQAARHVNTSKGVVSGVRSRVISPILQQLGSMDTSKLAQLQELVKDGGSLDQLKAGADKLEAGVKEASGGAGQLAGGTSALAKAAPALASGIKQLDSGTLAAYKGSSQLLDGLKRYNDEGIQKLVAAYNDNVAGLGERVDAIAAAGEDYQNFSGRAPGTKGSVKFIYETDAVEAE